MDYEMCFAEASFDVMQLDGQISRLEQENNEVSKVISQGMKPLFERRKQIQNNLRRLRHDRSLANNKKNRF